MQLNKILCFLLIIIISCNGGAQNNDQKTQTKKESEKIGNINFLDKKYVAEYHITIDESNLSDHPIYSYLDCNNEGYFTVHAVPTQDHTKYYWEKLYPTQLKDFEEEKKYIKKIMAEDPNGYTLFSYWIPSKYIKRKENCTEESIVIDKSAVAKIYYYDESNKNWNFIEEINSNILPPYRDNSFFEKEFPKFLDPNAVSDIKHIGNTYEPYEMYLSILLTSYLKDGINAKNIISNHSKSIIESTISKYTHQSDFYKDSFFKRESEIVNPTISSENLKIWKLCNEKLDFSGVAEANELESDWRYPYKKIKSLNVIYDLYNNSSYGDSFEGRTLPQQMALYMYFLSWKERKAIYDEIDQLKTELSKSQ